MKTSINALLSNTAILNAESNFGFNDWNSAEKTLERRMSVLIPKLKFLVDAGIIDGDNNYAFFKNCNAHSGSKGTYDDVRIMTLPENENETSVYLGGFCFQTWGFVEGGNAHFFTIHDDATNDDDAVKCVDFIDWADMKKSLKNDAELLTLVRAHFNKNYVEPVIEVKEKIVKAEKPKIEKATKVKAKAEKIAKPKKTTAKNMTKIVDEVKAAIADVEIIE